MDGLLQHYNGLQLVGPGHEVDDMEAAMTGKWWNLCHRSSSFH